MKVDYTEISKTYDRYRSYPKNLIREIIAFGEISEKTKVLDLGCGTGKFSLQLLELIDADVICVDLSMPMLKRARGKSLQAICADLGGSKFPFSNYSFDTITGVYVLHQISNLLFLFSECHRVLRNGIVILLTSSHKQIECQHPVIKEFFPGLIELDKKRFPDISTIDHLLSSAGFNDLRYEEVIVEDIPVDQEYLQKVKHKYISTYHLLPEGEFQRGVERLEAFIKSRSQPEFREWRGTMVYGKKI